ncbi:MAG: 2-hydroxy-3-oxopropionate reductase [Proteobacteria bacterium]|nr:MAG: 2-hydroxy-3-oxopropionate reductase [Pseudomonadota bacterium]
MKKIAFLGTGIMGFPMARRLCEVGYLVKAWNRNPGKAMELSKYGAIVTDTACEAVSSVDIIILMLSTGDACSEILFGLEGIVKAVRHGAVIIVMSSIPVNVARDQASRLQEIGIDYLDAPVSGGERGAISGTLTIMVGGDLPIVEHVRSVLEVMGRVTHVGGIGCGQLAKLANQVIVGISIGAVAEAFLLAERGGVDLGALKKALSGGFADSTVLQQHGERMIGKNFKPGGTAETQLKDLSTANALAKSLGLTLPFLSLGETLFREMCQTSQARLDHSALYLTLQERNKV